MVRKALHKRFCAVLCMKEDADRPLGFISAHLPDSWQHDVDVHEEALSELTARFVAWGARASHRPLLFVRLDASYGLPAEVDNLSGPRFDDKSDGRALASTSFLLRCGLRAADIFD